MKIEQLVLVKYISNKENTIDLENTKIDENRITSLGQTQQKQAKYHSKKLLESFLLLLTLNW